MTTMLMDDMTIIDDVGHAADLGLCMIWKVFWENCRRELSLAHCMGLELGM